MRQTWPASMVGCGTRCFDFIAIFDGTQDQLFKQRPQGTAQQSDRSQSSGFLNSDRMQQHATVIAQAGPLYTEAR
ncbi:MAG: hypothetical protein EB141_02840 [Verrucomicrobia bacterium]|nr:hypothetical protein [Verrucomicrobiota bacterium]NBU09453.1 hypothetical protein [Pseudomonadota bacterium]NDA66662.1 hypothetical protein [Verrucomicrobiota bacterium]NDB74574.1 hypothetical protein [Verrucomicrobiota bacterium]NDD37928.1 hypothetical protein [Verrucomicrobiota bacterium]